MILNKYPKNTNFLGDMIPNEELYSEKFGLFHGKYAYNIQCDTCREVFTSDIPKKYCCKKCATKGNTELRKKHKADCRNKVCEHCKKPFTPKRIDALYCSNACRMAAYRAKPEFVENKCIYTIITPDLNASDKPKYIKFLDTLKEYGVTAAIDIREYGIDMFGKSARRISMLPFSQRNIKCLFRGGLSDRFVKGKYGPIRFSLREESIDLNKYEEEYRANLELEIDEEFINFIRSHGKIAIVFEKHFNMNNEFRVLTETLKEKCNLEEIINL